MWTNSENLAAIIIKVEDVSMFNLLTLAMGGLMGVANVGNNDKVCDLVSDNINLAKNGESDKIRSDAIYNVSEMLETRGRSCRLSDGDVKKLADMLDSEQGSVIAWAAVSLGYVGERARGTVPKMLMLLAKNSA